MHLKIESDYPFNLERTLIKLPISTQICVIDRKSFNHLTELNILF